MNVESVIENLTPPEIKSRCGAIVAEAALELAALVRLAPHARQESADAISAKLAGLISSLSEIASHFAGETTSCWRCGANLSPPDRDVEAEIEANVRGAAWAGWSREDFVAKARQTVQPGDRIVW